MTPFLFIKTDRKKLMLFNQRLSKINLLILFLLFFACTSTSMEFRSAKTAARSEKDLKKAEEWGIKALELESDQNNALVPYFLATEIYKPQKRWEEMAEMLDEAIRRNPEQELGEVKLLIEPEELTRENYDEMVIETIGEGVKVYREELWTSTYNKAIENITSNPEEALKMFNLCIKVDLTRGETYASLGAYYLANDNLEAAKEIIGRGLLQDPNYIFLYEVGANIASKQNNFKEAEQLYLKAINLSENPRALQKQLIFIYIDMGDTQKAIDLSNELLDIYFNDPDLYFNVGVLYQKLAINLYNTARDVYLELSESSNGEVIIKTYNDFIQCRNYANKSKENFMSSSDLEIEETGSTDAVKEMRKLASKIEDIFIPSIKEIAKSANITL